LRSWYDRIDHKQLQPDAEQLAAEALMVQIKQWIEQTELQLTAAALQRWV